MLQKERTLLLSPRGMEWWLVRGSRAEVQLCFGLEISNHTHDPVQIKGSVFKKKEKFNPQAKKGHNFI